MKNEKHSSSPNFKAQLDLESLSQSIYACRACPRLIEHCQNIARTKRRSYINDTYWGKPISGFGDPGARLVIVGLAPAAHGANRTGRIFTGDRSGEWLYRALHRAGFSNQAHSTNLNDGLLLKNTYVTCIVKCAPPDNKPSPMEQDLCSNFLRNELTLLGRAHVWIALGQMSFHRLWPILHPRKPRPSFQHGAKISLPFGKWLLLSYHPSQQNTFTKRLTEPMFDSVFTAAKKLVNNI